MPNHANHHSRIITYAKPKSTSLRPTSEYTLAYPSTERKRAPPGVAPLDTKIKKVNVGTNYSTWYKLLLLLLLGGHARAWNLQEPLAPKIQTRQHVAHLSSTPKREEGNPVDRSGRTHDDDTINPEFLGDPCAINPRHLSFLPLIRERDTSQQLETTLLSRRHAPIMRPV